MGRWRYEREFGVQAGVGGFRVDLGGREPERVGDLGPNPSGNSSEWDEERGLLSPDEAVKDEQRGPRGGKGAGTPELPGIGDGVQEAPAHIAEGERARLPAWWAIGHMKTIRGEWTERAGAPER